MKGQNFAKGTLQRSWKEFWDSQGLSWLLGIIKKDQSYLSLSMWNESNSFAVHIYSVFSKVKYNQKMLGDHRNKPFKTELRVSQLQNCYKQRLPPCCKSVSSTVFPTFGLSVSRSSK